MTSRPHRAAMYGSLSFLPRTVLASPARRSVRGCGYLRQTVHESGTSLDPHRSRHPPSRKGPMTKFPSRPTYFTAKSLAGSCCTCRGVCGSPGRISMYVLLFCPAAVQVGRVRFVLHTKWRFCEAALKPGTLPKSFGLSALGARRLISAAQSQNVTMRKNLSVVLLATGAIATAGELLSVPSSHACFAPPAGGLAGSHPAAFRSAVCAGPAQLPLIYAPRRMTATPLLAKRKRKGGGSAGGGSDGAVVDDEVSEMQEASFIPPSAVCSSHRPFRSPIRAISKDGCSPRE